MAIFNSFLYVYQRVNGKQMNDFKQFFVGEL
jgi:hypothetical protein